MIGLFRWKYEGGRVIRDNDGNIVTVTCTGLGQGDPISGLLYMLYSIPLLNGLKEGLKESENECRNLEDGNDIREGKVVAYLDDVCVINDPKVTGVNTPKIEPIYQRNQAKLNIPKSEIFGEKVFDYDEVPYGWKISSEGSIVVGVPVGEWRHRKKMIEEKLIKEAPPTQALAILHKNTQMILVTKSISRKGQYVVHTSSETNGILPLADTFDKAIMDEIGRITQLEITPVRSTIINLPGRHSGYGVAKTGGIEAEAAIIRGSYRLLSHVLTHFTLEQASELTQYINTEIVLGTYENVVEATEIDVVTYETMTNRNVASIMFTGKDKAYKSISIKLIKELGEKEETQQLAAMLLSRNGSSSGVQFITNTIGRNSETYFPEGNYAAVLRNGLGGGLTNNEPEFRTRPHGGTTYKTANNPSEALVCALSAPYRTKRHTEICKALQAVMKSMHPLDYIEREKTAGKIVTANEGRQDSVTEVIADIIWMDGPSRVIIDVQIVTPESQTFIAFPHNSHVRQGAAAEYGERRKRNHYGKVNEVNGERNNIPAESMIPFIIESSGRLGTTAFSFLNRVCRTQTYKRSKFISAVALICARYTGKMLIASRDRLATQLPFGG